MEEIDAEIARVKEELESAKGSDCDVYARIVGYYRAVRNWNRGKREEYGKRVVFRQDDAKARERLPKELSA